MLTEVCDFVHNYFEVTNEIGDFEISGGMIVINALDGQRFKIVGSALNDGIYTYHSTGISNDDDTEGLLLYNETFTGTIITMGVPRTFLKLVDEITTWQNANQAVLNSPYTSESFDGYSYTKRTGTGSNAGGALTWQDMFKSRLNAYRKIG